MPTVKELKLEAKELKIKGYYLMKKNDLMDAIKTKKNKQRVSIKTNLNDELKTELSKVKKIRIKKTPRLVWVGPLSDMEVSGDILKEPKKKFHTLEEAKEMVKRVNKDGIKYNTIIKLDDNNFQIRKAKKADRKKDRDIWVIDSEKDRILATMPTKKRTIKVKSVKAPVSVRDNIWHGPIENTEASRDIKSKQFKFSTLEEAKQKALELDDDYNGIIKINNKFMLRKIRRIDSNQRRTLWIKKSAKNKFM